MASIVDRPAVKPDCCGLRHLSSRGWSQLETDGSSDSVNGNHMGIGKFQPPTKANTPEPIDKKIGTIDYIREGTSCTKFGRNTFTGGFWANG